MAGLAQEKGELKVAKTIKLFIGGEFPRTESGRSFPVYAKNKKLYANLCRASRKDLRNAVTAAQGALGSWEHRAAYNRSQILYRMAEMAEAKRAEFIDVLTQTLGYPVKKADQAVDAAIDTLVYYAGFADKYQQLVGAVNPVSGPHHNFTTAEPVGVVALICDAEFDLNRVVASIAAIIVSGNTVVALLDEKGAAVLAPLSETFATSDLPKGVVNLLTGYIDELASHIGSHMEIQSLSFQRQGPEAMKLLGELQKSGAENMKRVVPLAKKPVSLEHLLSFVEYKTVWHPIGS